MRTLRKYTIPLFALLLLATSVSAETTTKRATAAAQFLNIGPGARATAMGGAFSAVASDVSAVYWNPAGIAGINQVGIFASNIQWLADIQYNFFAVASPLGYSGAAALFITSLQVPEDEVRTVAQPEGTGERFSAADMAIGVLYARQISSSFSFGIVGKYIQERIWTMTSRSVAIDVGTLYRSSWRDLQIGITMSNFGTPMKLAGRANLIFADAHPFIDGNIETIRAELEMEKWEIPLNVRTAISTNLIDRHGLRVIVALDIVHPSDNLEYFNSGAEIIISEMFSLRTGMRGFMLGGNQDDNEGGFTFGGGLNVPFGNTRITADYALGDYGRLGNAQQFSFNLIF